MAKPVAALGGTFKWNTSTTVGRLTNIGEVKTTLETKSNLLHDSPSGYPEVTPTTRKVDPIKLKGAFDPADAGQIALIADQVAGTQRAWVLTASDGSWTWSGNGYCVSAGPTKDGTGDTYEFEAEIVIDGAPTYAAQTSTGLTTPFFSVTGSAGAGTITPAAADDSYEYVITLPAGSTTYYITPTAATGAITVIDSSGNEQTVLTGANSTNLTAPTDGMETVYILQKNTGKVAARYTLHVGEPV